MKFKTSKKEVKDYYGSILSVGYCELQFLLRGEEAESYCSGAYGWNCDNYKLKGSKRLLLVSTGYSPIGDQNIPKEIIKRKYDIIKKYEKKAEKINHNHALTWLQVESKLTKLIQKFVDEILESEEV